MTLERLRKMIGGKITAVTDCHVDGEFYALVLNKVNENKVKCLLKNGFSVDVWPFSVKDEQSYHGELKYVVRQEKDDDLEFVNKR